MSKDAPTGKTPTVKEIEDKGPQVDNTPWDEADNKTKSHVNLSLGAQATNIFHQRFPPTDIQKCTKDALVEQLRESFIQTTNETFDRFQFFRCQQKEGESLEVFHSRIRKHASVCNWEHLEYPSSQHPNQDKYKTADNAATNFSRAT